jgi:Domain of unknown function (DUF4190)
VSHPPQAQYQQYGPPSYGPPAGPPPKRGAGLAIASMVLGIIALLLSWIPIINNVAAIIAVVGLGLGIPALIRARRGTHNGSGMAITGLVTSVLAIVLVILTQMLFVKAIDEVEKSVNESLAEVEAAPVDPGAEEAVAETAAAVALGVPAQVGDYEVTVDAVELDANETVAGANDWNEPPTGQYVMAQLTVTYTGAEEGMPGFDLTAIFHGTDSRQYSDTECSAVLPDDAMDAPTLNSGGSDTFQFCMDVQPTAIQGGQLSIEPTLSFADERVFYAIG